MMTDLSTDPCPGCTCFDPWPPTGGCPWHSVTCTPTPWVPIVQPREPLSDDEVERIAGRLAALLKASRG